MSKRDNGRQWTTIASNYMYLRLPCQTIGFPNNNYSCGTKTDNELSGTFHSSLKPVQSYSCMLVIFDLFLWIWKAESNYVNRNAAGAHGMSLTIASLLLKTFADRVNTTTDPYKEIVTTVHKTKLSWHGHVTRSSGLAKTMLQRTMEIQQKKRSRQKQRW